MKIRIVPQISYAVEAMDGRKIGNFDMGDEWRGMTYLSSANGDEIVIESPATAAEAEASFGRLFSDDPLPKPYHAVVVRASRNVIERLAERQIDTNDEPA